MVTMGVPPPTVSGLLQQSIMRQPFQSVAGFELKREVALKGDAFALTELLSRITEMASTVSLMGALAGKVRDPIQSEYSAMALRVGLGQKAE